MAESSIISARYLKRGDLVAMYRRTFRVLGTFEIFEGELSCCRVVLASCSNRSHLTFLCPTDSLYKTASNTYVPVDL